MNRIVYLFYFLYSLHSYFLPTVPEYSIVFTLKFNPQVTLSMIMIDRRQLCNASDEQRRTRCLLPGWFPSIAPLVKKPTNYQAMLNLSLSINSGRGMLNERDVIGLPNLIVYRMTGVTDREVWRDGDRQTEERQQRHPFKVILWYFLDWFELNGCQSRCNNHLYLIEITLQAF